MNSKSLALVSHFLMAILFTTSNSTNIQRAPHYVRGISIFLEYNRLFMDKGQTVHKLASNLLPQIFLKVHLKGYYNGLWAFLESGQLTVNRLGAEGQCFVWLENLGSIVDSINNNKTELAEETCLIRP